MTFEQRLEFSEEESHVEGLGNRMLDRWKERISKDPETNLYSA